MRTVCTAANQDPGNGGSVKVREQYRYVQARVQRVLVRGGKMNLFGVYSLLEMRKAFFAVLYWINLLQ